MSRSSLRRALGALVSVTFLDASGREVQVTGTLDEVSESFLAVVGASIGDAPIDGRLFVPVSRVVTVQEPEWR
mgnify:CR=1 FL=1